MKKHKLFWMILGVATVVVIITLEKTFSPNKREILQHEVASFNDCVESGYPILESYPRQCTTSDGRTFTEEIAKNITYTNATSDMIHVELPFPGSVTGKEFTVIGEARGYWFFEASFPVMVIDTNGKIIAQAVAQAEGSWMTPDFVPFKATIKVPSSYIGKATLILEKDNPSGLQENDASISFPFTIEY